jgi:thiopeptide-type bacteriocin biosynthesis protein
MKAARGRFEFEPQDFFVLRRPLLPVDELLVWSAGLESPAAPDNELEEALTRDHARLTERLRVAIARPDVREAIYLASPDLFGRLHAWEGRTLPDEDETRITRALVRYFTRMASRPTPFGLFAGVGVGAIAAETRLAVSTGGVCRHVHLDVGYVEALTVLLQKDPAVRAKLRYQANTSLSQTANRIHYVETHHRGAGRVYTLAAVDASAEVCAVLHRSAEPTTHANLVATLISDDVDMDEATSFVNEMIDAQLLVSDIEPAVTGTRSLDDLCNALAALDARTAGILCQVAAAFRDIEAAPLGVSSDEYARVRALLAELSVPNDGAKDVFQVDMRLSADITLGTPVVEEFARAAECLFRIGLAEPRPLEGFAKAFVERYELREVPLLEALDEEVGLGLPPEPPDASREREQTVQQVAIMRLLASALAAGKTEIVLTDSDVDAIAYRGSTVDLPPGFSVMGAVSAADADAIRDGNFRLVLDGASGPSGAILFSRFCHNDPVLATAVARQLAAEEAVNPQVIHAELVHLTEGRMGNVLARPVLRSYEIPFLGRSGAPPDKQLRLDDLLVSVRDGRIILRSRRLGSEVVPHLTSAHNPDLPDSLPVYRFLARFERRHSRYAFGWPWGALSQLAFVPRVTYGRTVLSRAAWTMSAGDFGPLVRAKGVERLRAVRTWREEKRLPRLVQLRDFDNTLFVDLDNPLCVDVMLNLVKRRPTITLVELLPAPEEAVVASADGRFLHQIVIPFVRRRPEQMQAPASRHVSFETAGPCIRRFPPGSECLYAKLFCGAGVADRVLRDVVAPLVEQVIGSGTAHRWFFIRYADPHPHIRLRFFGEPSRLNADVLPALAAATAPFMRDGRIWRVQLDTYEREVERYGGPVGVELAERLFAADSAATLHLVREYGGATHADHRVMLTVAGIDRLLADFGIDPVERVAFLATTAPDAADFPRAQGDAYRRLRGALERALGGAADPELQPGFVALARRSAEVAPIAVAIRSGVASGAIERPTHQLLLAFTHLFVNRLAAIDPTRAETRYYDFIRRFHVAQLARGRAQTRRQRAHDEVMTALA